MSKSEQLIEQEGRCGVGGEVCFHFPLDSDDFFIDVISWVVFFARIKSDPRNHTKQHEERYLYFQSFCRDGGSFWSKVPNSRS